LLSCVRDKILKKIHQQALQAAKQSPLCQARHQVRAVLFSVPKTPEKPLEPEVDPAVNRDSPGTPNSEMDLLLSQQQQQSPVIRKMTKPVVPIILSDDEDEDSLEAMFSQPIPKSSSSKKGNKRMVDNKIDSGDEDDDDIWSDDVIKEKPNQSASQTELMPLRRSSRKRSKKGSDN
jgi:hypothetical protein